MKKFLLIFSLFILGICGYCKDTTGSDTDINSNSALFNKGFDSQKQISTSEFNKTVQMLKDRALTKKQKKLQKEVVPNETAYDKEHLDNFVDDTEDNNLSNSKTVMIPVVAYDEDGNRIKPGYYKLTCRKIADNSYVLDLSQGAKRLLSVNAYQTDADLERDTLNFCDAEIIDGNRIRLMYGNIELNLAGYIYFK